MAQVVNLAEKLSTFDDRWNPRIVARCNGQEVRLAKVEGDFTWHTHKDSDELFFVVDGELGIEMRDRTVRLGAGEMFVVPRGTEHRPFAEAECHIMMLDEAGEPNTGDSPSIRTRETLEVR